MEAIHLLLAIPLFVVIVGVDPRWMEKALSKQFSGLLSGGADAVVTPLNYLEKIFQIPFRLKDVDDTGFRALIASQFAITQPENRALVLEQKKDEDKKQGNIAEKQGDAVKNGDKIDAAHVVEINNPKTPPINKKEDRLIISKEEVAFMQELSVLIPNSPRTIKRYVNIYRIIRSHADLRFNEKESLSYYQAVIIMLSVLINSPLLTKSFFEAIGQSDDETALGIFLAKPNIKANFKNFTSNLESLISSVDVLRPAANIPMSCFKLNTQLVSRFCFYYK